MSAGTIEFLLDQLGAVRGVRARKMFGEYALYCGEKVVALVCDDQLFVKPTAAGKTFIGKVKEGAPYPGAKPWFLIAGDRCGMRAYSSRQNQEPPDRLMNRSASAAYRRTSSALRP